MEKNTISQGEPNKRRKATAGPHYADAPEIEQPDEAAAAEVIDRYWMALSNGDAKSQSAERSGSSRARVIDGELEVLDLLHAARQDARSSDTPAECRDWRLHVASRSDNSDAIWPDGMFIGGELHILSLLDRGGMGEVYVAWHGTLNCEVAVKVLPKKYLTDSDAVARFRKTIQAQARLGGHENIVATMNASEEQGRLYLVMEYVPGTDLAAYVRRAGRLDWREACAFIRQAASGLHHAHAHGVIHRDIKPSNLIRSTSGTIKILDWGLARCDAIDSSSGGLTGTGVGMGTVDYMAPEQALDAKRSDQRSDLYSLGCTFYFLLAGEAPFTGESTPVAKLLAHDSKQPRSISDLRADVPRSIDTVVRKLMAKQPAERFESAQSFIQALDVAVGTENPRVTRRPWRSATIGLALACAALGWWLTPPALPPNHVVSAPTAGAKLGPPTIEELGLFVISKNGNYEYVPFKTGGELASTPPARCMVRDEAFRIEGHFRQPESWWIFWLDTRGKIVSQAQSSKPQPKIGFPQGVRAATIPRNIPAGTQVLLLVTAVEQNANGVGQLIKTFQDTPIAPPVGLCLWSQSDENRNSWESGGTSETAQTYIQRLSGRLPAGFEMTAAIFLPWEPEPIDEETSMVKSTPNNR
jgi:serine/threonine protein kinase